MTGVASRLPFYFLIGMFAVVTVLSFLVFQPFLMVLSLAAVAAVLLHPIHDRLIHRLRIRPSWAALIVIVGVIVVVGTLASVISSRVFLETQNLYGQLTTVSDDAANPPTLESLSSAIENPIRRFWPTFDLDLAGILDQSLGWFFDNLGPLFSGTLAIGFKTLLWFLSLYFLLKDGPKIVNKLVTLSPLGDVHDERILKRIQLTILAVVRGFLLVSLVQGLLAGIGLAIFGVPNPTLWGGVAALAAVVPGVGTALVMIPAVIYLWVSGLTGAALGLLAWAVVVVGLVDNFLAPQLYARGGPIHPLVMLFAVLGGLAFFGPAGFIMGPLVISLLVALLEVYRGGQNLA